MEFPGVLPMKNFASNGYKGILCNGSPENGRGAAQWVSETASFRGNIFYSKLHSIPFEHSHIDLLVVGYKARMLSRSFLLHNKNSKDSIFLFKFLLHPIPDVHNPNLNSLSYSFSTLPPQHCPDIGYKLNHKDWLSPNEVVKIFENLRDPNSTLSVWNQYCRRKDYKPNGAIYTIVISQLSEAKNFDAIEDIMQRIKLEKSCRLSNEFFYGVIKIYAHSAGRIKKALETLLDMPKGYNCWPTVKTFNLVLNFLVSAKLFEEVQELYLQAPMLGVEIDACCLNILIKGLCANGDLSSALKVFDEFPKQRCRPNVRTFSTLMYYLCAKGEVKEAFGLFDQMEREGIEADTITFNILISGLMKQKKIDEGRELLEKMKLRGCEPNEASYQEVLYGLLDVGKFLEAKEFMGEMISKRMNPSLSSYKKVVRGLCKANLIGDVELVMMQMVKQGFVPREGIWKSVTRSLFRGASVSNKSLDEITNL